MLVVTDGNGKCRRQRCHASFPISEAYDLNSYSCHETPLRGSYYCEKHLNLNADKDESFDSNYCV